MGVEEILKERAVDITLVEHSEVGLFRGAVARRWGHRLNAATEPSRRMLWRRSDFVGLM